nr:Chain C, Retinoblastoma-associated protein [Homo sapiens]
KPLKKLRFDIEGS